MYAHAQSWQNFELNDGGVDPAATSLAAASAAAALELRRRQRVL